MNGFIRLWGSCEFSPFANYLPDVCSNSFLRANNKEVRAADRAINLILSHCVAFFGARGVIIEYKDARFTGWSGGGEGSGICPQS